MELKIGQRNFEKHSNMIMKNHRIMMDQKKVKVEHPIRELKFDSDEGQHERAGDLNYE